MPVWNAEKTTGHLSIFYLSELLQHIQYLLFSDYLLPEESLSVD